MYGRLQLRWTEVPLGVDSAVGEGWLMRQSADKTAEAVRQQEVDQMMRSAISAMALDLSDIGVLTEAASGHFESTCLMAALAGARPVVAVAKDSEWGQADEIVSSVRSHAQSLGVEDHLRFVSEVSPSAVGDCSLVTNLGFVRPVTDRVLSALPADAAVSLMCEPWEVRSSDVDIGSAISRSVAVAGTNETHPLVRTFEYLGPLAGQLMSEVGVEIGGSTLLVVASAPFARPIRRWLLSAGARRVDLETPPLTATALRRRSDGLDVLLVAHMGERSLGGSEIANVVPSLLAKSGAVLLVIAGDVDPVPFLDEGVKIGPPDPRPAGRMWVTTSVVGPRPVVDLHCAGLKVGELLVRARRLGLSVDDAVTCAVDSGFGLAVDAP